MSDKRSMEEFKAFLKKHPSLVYEVRRGIYTWQEVYEDWYLLGEKNKLWESFREAGAAIAEEDDSQSLDKEEVASLFDVLKKMDVQSMQKHVANLSQALGTISGVISQFQGSPTEKADEKAPAARKQSNPFALRRD